MEILGFAALFASVDLGSGVSNSCVIHPAKYVGGVVRNCIQASQQTQTSAHATNKLTAFSNQIGPIRKRAGLFNASVFRRLMARLWMKFLLVVVLSSFLFTGSWGGTKEAHYLSFEERWTLSYLLAAIGEPAEIQEQYKQRLFRQLEHQALQPAQIITVNNFQEFLKAYQGEWPNAQSLQVDLDLLERIGIRQHAEFKGATSALQKQMDAFIEEQNQYLRDKIAPRLQLELGKSDLLNLQSFTNIRQQLQSGISLEAILNPMIEQSSERALEVLNEEFKQVSSLGKELAGTLHGDEVFNAMMVKVLGGYFENMSLPSKKQIASQLLGINLDATPIEKFEIMVMNSGPQFQKLLQIMAREAGVDDDLMAVFRQLESKVRRIPDILVKDIIDPEMAAYGIVSYDPNPIGVGTIAQVHRGILRKSDGQLIPVVIRILKPGIAERIEEDRVVLTVIAPDFDNDPVIVRAELPKLAPLVDDLAENVRAELSLSDTLARQARAGQVYPRVQELTINDVDFKIVIHVTKVYIRDKNSKLMVQEFAEGAKLDKVHGELKETYPDLKKSLVEEISKVWMQELFFNSGFFHSDLHQGNFMVKVDGLSQKIHLSILDFGMAGELTELQRRSFLLLAAGIQIDDPQMMTEALWSLRTDKSTISKDELLRLLTVKVADTHRRGVQISNMGIFSWALKVGLKFPQDVLGVNRGMTILERMLSESGSDLTMPKVGVLVAKDNIWKMKTDLRSTEKVSYIDLIKLWVSSLKKARPLDMPAGMCSSAYR